MFALNHSIAKSRFPGAYDAYKSIPDATFAEKVDFAIPAAAFKFEELAEQVDKTQCDESNVTALCQTKASKAERSLSVLGRPK
jgi:hypothetical protein